MRKYQRQVAAGIALLDKMRPGWRHRLCPETLEMWHCDRCVLGQLYGEYQNGLARHFWPAAAAYSDGGVVGHGFCIPLLLIDNDGDKDAAEWKALKAEWLLQLTQTPQLNTAEAVEEPEWELVGPADG